MTGLHSRTHAPSALAFSSALTHGPTCRLSARFNFINGSLLSLNTRSRDHFGGTAALEARGNLPALAVKDKTESTEICGTID